jgi:hypothetical protein
MSEALAFADAVAARCASVLAQKTTRSARCLVGNVPFRLVAPTGAGERWIGSALPAADGTTARDDEHTITVWDGASPDTAPPPRPWRANAHEPLGLVEGFCDERVRCGFDVHTGSLIVQDGAANASYVWYSDLAALPAWAQASPFRIALSWLANSHGMQIVHGAAVAIAGRAALLFGEGGAGKSTTALACALSGMAYLGDDYCVAEPSSRRVHLLYKTAKLFSPSLRILPHVRPWLMNAERLGQEKGVIFLNSSQIAFSPSAEIAAILLPRVTGHATATLRKASSRDALHAVLPSTVRGMMGGTTATASLLMKLANSAPVYHLDLGTEIESVVDAVSSALEGRHV